MAAQTLTRKIIAEHLVEGDMEPGAPVSLRIDQTLTQDATGTMVMLALEAMGLERVRTELSAQYVDHNLIQEDNKNPDDHVFLESACRKLGVWFSRPGNGVSHPVHMQRFGKPGKTMAGSDSHTPAAGSLGMLAIGAGGLDVAMCMAGQPLTIPMPKVFGVRLTGTLPNGVSAKDVILEMLRRHDVDGAKGCVLEYFGPGLECLSAMDRHVIANMGTELGATSTVFPSDGAVRAYLAAQGRPEDWIELAADEDCAFDLVDEIDLSRLEPLIAKPSSPGNVVPVTEVAGEDIYQSYIGSSANPGFRDFAVPARMLRDRAIAKGVSFDVNPTSRQLLESLSDSGDLGLLVRAGARLHQAGCNGCIGMGQAPAHGRNSLRTVPRNFPGRSGTEEDSVFLCSPETATASAIAGVIADPRALDFDWPAVEEPVIEKPNLSMLQAPPTLGDARAAEIVKGPNIAPMPRFEALPDALSLPIGLVVGDDVSTDEIMPAGSKVLPYRSNIPKIAEFVYRPVDKSYVERALKTRDDGGHAIVGGKNYGQGSSREHAALAPRFLGLRAVLARDFARIHWQNLVNYGILPLTFAKDTGPDAFEVGDEIVLDGLRDALPKSRKLTAEHRRDGKKKGKVALTHDLSARQVEVLLAGGLVEWMRDAA